MGRTIKNDTIADELFEKYTVNRGLRDVNGKGVLTGLTNISEITSFAEKDGKRIPIDGQLWYRGYSVERLVAMFGDDRFGYEALTYLLLFGELPDEDQRKAFLRILSEARNLPTNFVRDVIMKAPTRDIMNSMTRSILTLASYDQHAQQTDLGNVIRQSIMLIATFPMLAIYGYHAYNHYENLGSMYIHRPDPGMSTAENILMMLRPDRKFTATEARVLQAALILHMEHGGGNNSTFTTRVVTSSGSDTYATIAAAMSSLKGPRHGGANIKVMEMMQNIRENVRDWKDDEEIAAYLTRMIKGSVFDHKGLIYGMGHAVYSLSDPRERVFRSFVERLSVEKGRGVDLDLYKKIEEIAPKVIARERRIYKGVSPNVDFYSGFVYDMLDFPVELYTPLFAIARITGWSAHRLEEIVGMGKILRPAYMSVMKRLES
ncbi:MAG: citrate/2-methylcitrate synthase [Eubacteriales bacterium]|nr:citrate/2-methylcitrate synthase [Lachnospiraceae bacterium]MDO4417254.1 citrate/2-methylcitrate synthase [Eubacteriales bacterium]